MSLQEKCPPMIFEDNFIERVNIAWRIEPAEQDPVNPLLESAYPWDSASPCVGHGTVLKDPVDGMYKAWVVSAEEVLDYNIYRPSNYEFRICYFCSEDGVNWQRPELDINSYPGYEKTNIVFDYPSGGRSTYASVFVDPDENPEEPYEIFVYRDVAYKNPALCVEGFGQQSAENPSKARELYYGLYRYRSKDGLHWRGVEGPLEFKSGDTLYVHKNRDGGYVAHHKNGIPSFPGGYVPYDIGAGECRINLRKTSADGTEWSESAPIMMPDWKDHQGDQIMETGYFPYGRGIIGLTSVYHATSQTMDLQFAASIDGIKWCRPSRRSCLPLAPLGDYGGGMIWPTRTLVETGDRLYVYYGATDGLHGDIYALTANAYRPFSGAFCRASWEKGRMWAVVPASGGEIEARLTTPLCNCTGMELLINAVTVNDGEITAELLDNERKPIKGFTRESSIAFKGDKKFASLKWKGMDTLPTKEVSIRFYLKKARLYGFEWK